jgi:hypothetical protein
MDSQIEREKQLNLSGKMSKIIRKGKIWLPLL